MVTLKVLKSCQIVVLLLCQHNFQMAQMWSKKEKERMTKLLSGIHRRKLPFTQEKVMSWFEVEDQEPDLGHLNLRH